MHSPRETTARRARRSVKPRADSLPQAPERCCSGSMCILIALAIRLAIQLQLASALPGDRVALEEWARDDELPTTSTAESTGGISCTDATPAQLLMSIAHSPEDDAARGIYIANFASDDAFTCA
eukprot:1445499-Prymnesium_polylepis.1